MRNFKILISVCLVAVGLCLIPSCKKKEKGLSPLEILLLTGKYSCAQGGWVPGGALLFGAESQKKRPYVPGEVLVTFKPRTSQETVLSSLHGMDVKKRIQGLGEKTVHHVATASNESVDDAVLRLRNDPNVESVQPNFLYHSTTVPTDPSFTNQWGFQNSGQTVNGQSGTAGFDMDATTAWTRRTDCSSVIVAVLDSGVNYNQEDLAANMWDDGSGNHGYDFIRSTVTPMDYFGHGTHVAGTIGAAANNGVGGVGVCWTAKIMSVRVMDATGSGSTLTIAQGIRWAVDHGAKVINASLGGPGGMPGDVMDQAIAYAKEKGVLFVAAAGNDGANNDSGGSFPANYDQDNIISVAAVDQFGGLATFSNYGANCVDVGAPGVNIYSTFAGVVSYNGSTVEPGTTTNVYAAPYTAWTRGAQWGLAQQNYGVLLWMLTNPPGVPWWQQSLVTNSDTAYAAFNASNLAEPALTFYADYAFRSGDYLQLNYSSTGATPPGTMLDTFSGSTGGYVYGSAYDLKTACGGKASCSLGFQMHGSTGGGVGYGSAIAFFQFTGMDPTSLNKYAYEQGTSMAAPHVAGLAALVWAEHPGASYLDVKNAILASGTSLPSLEGKTITGKMIKASAALSAIH